MRTRQFYHHVRHGTPWERLSQARRTAYHMVYEGHDHELAFLFACGRCGVNVELGAGMPRVNLG